MKPQPIRREKLPGRNEKCPCGSGKKAKKCCLNKIKALAALPPRIRAQAVVASILGHWPNAEIVTPPAAPEGTTQVIQIKDGTLTLEDGTVIPVESGEIPVTTPETTA